MTSYMMSVFPEASKGGDYGALGTICRSAGSLGPTLVGAASEHVSFIWAYLDLGGCLLVYLALVALLHGQQRRNRSGTPQVN